jgi:DNA-binding CsgD family transcriptional regulator
MEEQEKRVVYVKDINEYYEEKAKKNLLLTEVQYNILKLYRQNKNLTQREVGKMLNLPQNKISYHLKMIRRNNPELQKELMKLDKRSKYKIFRL